MIIKFKVPGKPIGKQETQFNSKTGHAYKPNKSRWYLEQVRLIAQAHMKRNNIRMIEGPVYMRLDIILNQSKNHPKMSPTKKPDMSNVLKTVEDALNKVCYDDDKNIVESEIFKWFGLKEGIVITIIPSKRKTEQYFWYKELI